MPSIKDYKKQQLKHRGSENKSELAFNDAPIIKVKKEKIEKSIRQNKSKPADIIQKESLTKTKILWAFKIIMFYVFVCIAVAGIIILLLLHSLNGSPSLFIDIFFGIFTIIAGIIAYYIRKSLKASASATLATSKSPADKEHIYIKKIIAFILFWPVACIAVVSSMAVIFPIMDKGIHNAGDVVYEIVVAVFCGGMWFALFHIVRILDKEVIENKFLENKDVIIKFSRSSILAWIFLMLIAGLFFSSLVVTDFSRDGFKWELLFAPIMLAIPFYYVLKYTKILFKLTPGLVINKDGFINYLYEEPKLISWEELCQGKSIYHGTGKSDWSHIYVRTDKGSILVDDHFNYLILKIRPKKFLKILEERCAEYRSVRHFKEIAK